MMAVFFFITHERILNFMRNPKLAHILVSPVISETLTVLALIIQEDNIKPISPQCFQQRYYSPLSSSQLTQCMLTLALLEWS